MAELINTTLDALSTTGLQFTISDVDGVEADTGAVISIKYTWSDGFGTIINSREDVSIIPANPFIIKFIPEDLATIKVKTTVRRLLKITVIYTDNVLGETQKVKEYEVVINCLTGRFDKGI